MALRRSQIEELKDQLEQLKDKFAEMNGSEADEMSDDVKREARRMYSQWKEKTQEAVESMKDKTQAAWGKAKDTGRSVQNYTEENPWQALALAALAGVVIGSMMRRNRD